MQPGMSGTSEPVPPPPMPVATQKKFNGKVVVGMVLVLVALIFAAVALVGSWWDMKMTVTAPLIGETDTTLGFGVGSLCASVKALGQTVSACGSYSAGYSGASLTDVSNIMNLGYILTILGLLMAILTFILIIVGAGKPKLKIAVLLFGIIGAVVLLVAFVYVYSALPGAINTAFSGAFNISGYFGSFDAGTLGKISWGGGMGWYMALMGFILLLIGAIIATTGMKAQPAPMAPPPM